MGNEIVGVTPKLQERMEQVIDRISRGKGKISCSNCGKSSFKIDHYRQPVFFKGLCVACKCQKCGAMNIFPVPLDYICSGDDGNSDTAFNLEDFESCLTTKKSNTT